MSEDPPISPERPPAPPVPKVEAPVDQRPRKTRRRWFLKTVVALVVLVGVLVLTAPLIASLPFVTRKIEAAASEKLARKVEIGSHSIGWVTGVQVEDLVIYEVDGTTPFLKLKKADVRIAYRELLNRHADVKRVSLTGLDVRLVRKGDGTMNTDTLGKAPPKSGPPPSQPPPGPPQPAPPAEPAGEFRATVHELTVHGSVVTFVDEAKGTTAKFGALSVAARPGATADEIIAEMSARAEVAGAPPGDFEGKAKLLAFEKGKPRKEMSGTAELAWKNFDIGAFMKAVKPLEGSDFATGASSGTALVDMPAGGAPRITVDGTFPAMSWGDPGQPPMFASPTTVHQEIVYHKDTGRIDIPAAKISFVGAHLDIAGSLHVATSESDTDNPVDLVVRFDGEMSHFDELFPAKMAGQDHKGPLRSTWNIRGRNMDLFNLDGVAEVTSYFFTSTDEKTKEKTVYKVPHPNTLKFECHGSFDMKAREQQQKEDPKKPWGVLTGVTMKMETRCPWVQSESMDIKQLMTVLEIAHGEMDIRKFEFVLNDAKKPVSITGKVVFDAEDPLWNMRCEATGVDYSYGFSGLAALVNPALYANQKGQIEAKMGWKVNLTGRGFNMESVKQTVAGGGELALEKGALKGSPMLNELFAALKLTEAAKYEFDGMKQEFSVAPGEVTNKWSDWQGSGKEADLQITGTTKFDGTMKQSLTVKGDPRARWGNTTGSIVEVLNKAGGLPLGGTVDSPKIEIDYEKASKGLLEGILENPDLKEKAGGWIEDLLDGKKKKKK